MKLKAEREGNALSGMEVLGSATLYRNSVALYDLEVLVKLYGGELLFAVFGELSGGTFVGTTKPVPCFMQDTEEQGGELWSLCRCGIPNSVFEEAGVKAVSIEIKQPYLTNTGETKYRLITSGVKSFVVDESLADPEFDGMEEERADFLQAQISENKTDLTELDRRAEKLENQTIRKVLSDFTIGEDGSGIKYYSDGSTAGIRFPSGAGGGETVKTDWLRVLAFTEDSFIKDADGSYSVAFASGQTGFTDSNYIALLDQSGEKTYEAGQETAASKRQGYAQLADTFFKGSDGSLLLSGIGTPFAGRLILLGGSVFAGMFVSNIAYDENACTLNVTFANGQLCTLQLPKPMQAQRYIGVYAEEDWTGEAPPYTLSIPAKTHGKGLNPSWRFYDNQIYDVEVDGDGNMTVFSNTKKAVKIILI